MRSRSDFAALSFPAFAITLAGEFGSHNDDDEGVAVDAIVTNHLPCVSLRVYRSAAPSSGSLIYALADSPRGRGPSEDDVHERRVTLVGVRVYRAAARQEQNPDHLLCKYTRRRPAEIAAEMRTTDTGPRAHRCRSLAHMRWSSLRSGYRESFSSTRTDRQGREPLLRRLQL